MNRTKQAKDILNFWYAIEYLQPNKFPEIDVTKKPYKASERTQYHTYCFKFPQDGDIKKCLKFTLSDGLGEQDDEIQICVGRFEVRPIIEQIFADTGETIPEKIQYEHVCLFSLRIDSEGNYVEETLQVSPFAWCSNAIIRSKKLSFDNIGPMGNSLYCCEFEDRLKDKCVPLLEKVDGLYKEISNTVLGFLEDQERTKSKYAVIIFNKYKDEKAKDNYQGDYIYSDLQQSYFLKDLSFIRDKESERSKVLNYILALNENQASKTNMLIDKAKIEEWYTPDKLPLGQWPSKYSLSFMQQLAVNIGKQESKAVGDIFSVNGPPGTGKTTLLKEIVVANIIARASELMKYSCPDDAFSEKKLSGEYDQDTRFYYVPDDRLREYGMLVLSSNNNAVENITMELPKASQMKSDNTKTNLFDLEMSPYSVLWEKNESEKKEIYFSYPATLATEKQECWGLISARLGKRKNVNKFCIALNKIVFHGWKSETEKSGKISFQEAKTKYNTQYELVLKMRKPIEDSIKAELKLSKEKTEHNKFIRLKESEAIEKETLKIKRVNEKENKETLLNNLRIQIEKDKNEEAALSKQIEELINQISDLEDRRNFFERVIPNPQNVITKYIAKLFHTERMELLRGRRNEKIQKEKSRIEVQDSIKSSLADTKKIELEIRKHEGEVQLLDKQVLQLQSKIVSEKQELQEKVTVFEREREILEEKGIKFLTEKFFEGLVAENQEQYEESHCESLFIYEEYNVEREKLFYQALVLHKAFYLDSFRFRQNIIMLLKYWGNRKDKEGRIYKFSGSDRQRLAPALFNSLFLLVPVISSTFASVQTLLQDVVEENSLGMMIVDEAGQATPQMVVGALWRSRRAVVVGDPKQVEPVVTIPDCIYRKMFNDNVVLKKYIDKTLSVQVFADIINKYSGKLVSEKCGEEREEWVGCPLVVHRRCIDPMFSISNHLSYGGIMVNKTQRPKEEEQFIYDASCWIQCEGKEEGMERGVKNHYVKMQGQAAYSMIKTGIEKNGGDLPDLFIISPFKTVAETFKKELLIHSEFASDNARKWLDSHCGTVHTFQGKEAKEVIYMLGCDKSEQSKRAAGWVNENNVNVAITRAKHRLYLLGDKNVWNSNRVVDFARVRLEYVEVEKVSAM